MPQNTLLKPTFYSTYTGPEIKTRRETVVTRVTRGFHWCLGSNIIFVKTVSTNRKPGFFSFLICFFFLLLMVITGPGADGRFCPNIVSDNLPLRPGDPYHIVLPSSSLSSSLSSALSSLPSSLSSLFQHYCLIRGVFSKDIINWLFQIASQILGECWHVGI